MEDGVNGVALLSPTDSAQEHRQEELAYRQPEFFGKNRSRLDDIRDVQ
jgi:hypothetical protein